MIQTKMKWKPFGGTTLASTICYCLNLQLKSDENPKRKLISPIDIAGIIEFIKIDVKCEDDTKNEYSYIFRK